MHEENGIAERCWRTLSTMKDSLLIDSGLPLNFWAKAMDTSNYLRNRLSTRRADKSTIIPEEAWTGLRQNVEHVRIFGCKASTHVPAEKTLKIGYTKDLERHLH